MPNKKKHPKYYSLLPDPIDLQTIDKNINAGTYLTADQFDNELLRAFQNTLRYFGQFSPEGEAALALKKAYNKMKAEYVNSLTDIVGDAGVRGFRFTISTDDDPREDRIGCICGQFNDEGLMIQCEKCQVWQHCDCVGKSGDEESFYCAACLGKEPDLDIPLVPQPEYASPDEKYFISLVRDEKLTLRVGDTVYVLRAFKDDEEVVVEPPQDQQQHPQAEENFKDAADHQFNHGGIPHKMMSPLKGPSLEASSLSKGNYPTYKSVDPAKVSIDDMDIFRIERLWTNGSGERFAFGHHYLRPHETFHEPSRKFFPNEVFRVPIHEVLPLDSIWKQCWVMDPVTYGRGRPIGCVEEHVYICEYRVDKTARLFNKISKPKYPTCTKWFAFESFDQKIKPQRTHAVRQIFFFLKT